VIVKNTKNIHFFFPILFLSFALNAQQVFIESGFSTAFFEDYVNNLGENTLDKSYSKPKRPFIEAGFRFNLYRERIKLDVGTSYSTYKINTAFSYRNIKVPTSYDVSYIALKLGLNFSLVEWKRFKLQVHFNLSHDWLTTGTNSYRNEVVDIYKEKTLDRTLLRFHRGTGIEYEISEDISAYFKYNIANSLKEPNADSSNEESYSFETKAFSVGILLKIPSNKHEISEAKKEKEFLKNLRKRNRKYRRTHAKNN
jgi:hypothetical protein